VEEVEVREEEIDELGSLRSFVTVMRIDDVVIAAVGRLRYSVDLDQPTPQK
jgi:hypothetical protein